jgi:dehydrogenase/reductase SDR family protein 7
MKGNTNKIIWLTGASSGIGEALAYELSLKGYKLILSARNKKQLISVKEKCKYPECVAVLPLDLADFSTASNSVKTAISIYGGIDILINNAGISQRSLIMDTDLEVYEKLINVNYLGTVALTKEVLPLFISKRSGHFVTVTSLMGKFGSPYRSGYCAAKHALHGFFDVLRMEHDKDGIDVTLVCPGFVQTKVAINALIGDGSSQNTNDTATEQGMPPEIFARKMIRAIEQKKYEVYIGGKEIKGIYLKRFYPKLLHKTVLRSKFR